MEHGRTADTPALVLIVDDNPINSKLLENILKPQGYVTETAANAADAFSWLETATPDLILLDIMMPEVSGYDVARRIKHSSKLKRVPIIFLTAKHETDDIVAGFEAGGIDYVTKPFNSRELLARIHTHVALKRAREEIETLRGILPVCAGCKKIRENDGEWIALEEFISKHTEADVSHGMCPECVSRFYPEMARRILKRRKTSA
jgi:DNA-binding response OmpR family regulator